MKKLKGLSWAVAHSLWFNHPKSVPICHGFLFRKENNIHATILQFELLKAHSKKMAQVSKLIKYLKGMFVFTQGYEKHFYNKIESIFRT